MGLFVECNSADKGCLVLINIDQVIEIAPLVTGGCALFLDAGQVVKVKDNYDQFKQFALQTVSSDDIAKKIAKLKGATKEV